MLNALENIYNWNLMIIFSSISSKSTKKSIYLHFFFFFLFIPIQFTSYRDPSAKNFYISKLQPTSNYDVFIKDCNENYLTTEMNFQTLRDGKT